jgi:hypothetical protein
MRIIVGRVAKMTDRIKRLSDYEYSILDEIRRDEINDMIDFFNEYNSPDYTQRKLSYIQNMESENKQLNESDTVLREELRIFTNEIQSLKSGLEELVEYWKDYDDNFNPHEFAIKMRKLWERIK